MAAFPGCAGERSVATRLATWSGALLLSLTPLAIAPSLAAQEPEPSPAQAGDAAAGSPEGQLPVSLLPHIKLSVEGEANFRSSQDYSFQVPYDFDPIELPIGQKFGFERVTNPGQHFEVSNLSLLADAVWTPAITAHVRVNFINLYYRNPTSSGDRFDVVESWLRFGREADPATLPKEPGLFLKIGKFPKAERQNDRHLESYGLVSTAFNRFEDVGAELGADLGRHAYIKVSATEGNPLFIRDPNALAGDNGQPALAQKNPDPDLHSGIVILYDTHVTDVSLTNPQASAHLGLRFADEAGENGIELQAFGHRRKLADHVELDGTFYMGDLKLLRGPKNTQILPFKGDEKQEVGGTLWLYHGGLSFFAQYVDQKVADLPRTGIEAELAWRIDLPLKFAAGGQQLFTYLAPAVRYSHLANDFNNIRPTPAPSLAWDWTKVDAGLRLGIVAGVDLTVEYSFNTFVIPNKPSGKENELLSSLRWRI